MALKVVDRFTTRDGRWEIDNRPYGLTKEAFEKYGSWDIPGKGGAAHIFVYAFPGAKVEFYTEDGNPENHHEKIADSTGWCNLNLWASSAFWGESNGPWIVAVNEYHIAKGLGLPEGLHVSTFLIVEDVEEGSQPDPPPIDKPVSHIQVLVDGVMVFDNWSNSNGLQNS